MSVSTKLALIRSPTRPRAFSVKMQIRTELEAQLERLQGLSALTTRALAFITSMLPSDEKSWLKRRVLCPFWPGRRYGVGLQLAKRGACFVYERRAEAIHLFIKASTLIQKINELLWKFFLHGTPLRLVVLWWCGKAARLKPLLLLNRYCSR